MAIETELKPRFDVAANAPGGNTPLSLDDVPAIREVSDVNANVLTSSLQNGVITILAATAAPVKINEKE